MYVCLCTGATSQAVTEAVARGASTSRQVAAECGAGRDCGRCRRTVQAIITAAQTGCPAPVTQSSAAGSAICRSATCKLHAARQTPAVAG